MKCAYYSLIYYNNVREVQNISSKLITQATQIYYYNLGDKLSYPKICQKTFWIGFKKIINIKKQTYIPPIEIGVCIYIYTHIHIYIYIYIYDFLRKANIFNECTINDNGIILPAYIPKTNKSISHFLITEKQIIDIISKRNANKSQGYDNISVAILQVCPSKVAIPLQIIFQKCISSGTFPNFWKYPNIQHISLLPICGKILEKIILIMYMFFLTIIA